MMFLFLQLSMFLFSCMTVFFQFLVQYNINFVNMMNNNNFFMSENSYLGNNIFLIEDGEVDENGEKQNICKWIDCNQVFKEQEDLVRYFEKVYIDQRKGEDFTCFWFGCQRRYKSFNVRYKFFIYMRVYLGEKFNKCMVSIFYFVVLCFIVVCSFVFRVVDLV